MPQQDRLSSAAHVSRDWAKAAAAATTDVVLPENNGTWEGVESLNSWLKLHTGHTRSIQVPQQQDEEPPVLYLGLPVDLLTQLTSLQLYMCWPLLTPVLGKPFPALQTLVLHNVPNLCAQKSLVVQHLTALELINTPLHADNTTALQHLSTLTCLQSCVIGSRDDDDTPGEPADGDDPTPEALSYRCSSLTSLAFIPKATNGVFTADMCLRQVGRC